MSILKCYSMKAHIGHEFNQELLMSRKNIADITCYVESLRRSTHELFYIFSWYKSAAVFYVTFHHCEPHADHHPILQLMRKLERGLLSIVTMVTIQYEPINNVHLTRLSCNTHMGI